MAFLDSKQSVDLDLSTKEPIEVKLKIGSKIFLSVIVVTVAVLLVKAVK